MTELQESSPATAEFMAAQTFDGWDEGVLDKLPDAEGWREIIVNLGRCLRASAVVMTYDDKDLQGICKSNEEVEMWLELVECLNDRIQLSKDEIELMQGTVARLLVVLSRYETGPQ